MFFGADYLSTLRNVANTDLVLLYPQQDLSGDMKDISLNGTDITPSGPTQNGARMKDGSPCYLYDGINDWSDIDAGPAQMASRNLFSVMAWWRITDNSIWTDGNVHDVTWMYSSTSNLFTMSKTATNNQFQARCVLNSDNNKINTTAYNDTNWHCAVARIDARDPRYFDFFMDGNLIGSAPHTTNTTDTPFTISSLGAFRVGGSQFWAGNLGPFALWDKFLTDAEVAAISRIA